MRRALAVLGAVAMVALAVVVRGAIDDDGEAGSGDDAVVVVCATDLAAACEALDGVEVRTATAAETAAQIVRGEVDPEIDAWVTSSAWTEVLATRAPGVLDEPTVLGRTPVVVAADPARTTAIRDRCAGSNLWLCLADDAGTEWGEIGGDAAWGTLKVGLAPADTAAGLAVLASIAVGIFDGSDFAANDFDGARALVGQLVSASGREDPDPVRTLVTQRGRYSAVGTTQADVDEVNRPVDVLEVTPFVEVAAVMVRLPGGDELPSTRAARDALAEAGWSPADDELATILKPGVLAALHTLWTEITS